MPKGCQYLITASHLSDMILSGDPRAQAENEELHMSLEWPMFLTRDPCLVSSFSRKLNPVAWAVLETWKHEVFLKHLDPPRNFFWSSSKEKIPWNRVRHLCSPGQWTHIYPILGDSIPKTSSKPADRVHLERWEDKEGRPRMVIWIRWSESVTWIFVFSEI